MAQFRRSWIMPKLSPAPTPLPNEDSPGSLNQSSTDAQSNNQPAETENLAELEQEASQLILNGLERTGPTLERTPSQHSPVHNRASGSFGKMAFASMMSSLSLSRTLTNEKGSEIKEKDKEKDKERGRSLNVASRFRRSSSQAPPSTDAPQQRDSSASRARSQSPFAFRRFKLKYRDPSPTPEAIPLSQSDMDMTEPESIRTRTAFAEDPESGEEMIGGDDSIPDSEEEDDGEWESFDPITERNTERNAVTEPIIGVDPATEAELDHDPLGEGVNVVLPPEPYFPSTLQTGPRKRKPSRKKSIRHEVLPLDTSRPIFQRDRCTIIMTQGDPQASLTSRKRRRYVVASDLSEESRYAVEWGIGTVLRDGDEMLIIIVMEDESKVDPQIPNPSDRAQKLRSQQERQAMSYILVRQATQLLQRTKLNVRVSCQAWHAKNARHMLLDIVDYFEPMMLIVGSRGVGQLHGILLGSTAHYLIQRCSVPVMVARRRLKRPPKRVAHLAKNRTHVKLSEAAIDTVADKVDQDVQEMRDQIEQDDQRRKEGGREMKFSTTPVEMVEDDEGDDSGEEGDEEQPMGSKVAG